MGHHFPGEQPHAVEDLLLLQDLTAVHHEVDAIDPDRLPAFDLLDDAPGVADADALGAFWAIGRRARALRRSRSTPVVPSVDPCALDSPVVA